MTRTRSMWVTVAAAIVISGCSGPERPQPRSSEQPGERPAAVGTGGAGANLERDDEFVRDIALKNIAEVEFSRIALEKSTSPDIKTFAQQMIDEHGAASDKLKSLVSGQPMEWPARLDDRHRETADELTRKQAADFDRRYLEAMIEGHEDLAAKLESRLDVQSVADWKTAAAARTQSKAMPDPRSDMRDVQVRPNTSDHGLTMRINQWAAETYPVAQKHLDTARTLRNAIKKRSTT